MHLSESRFIITTCGCKISPLRGSSGPFGRYDRSEVHTASKLIATCNRSAAWLTRPALSVVICLLRKEPNFLYMAQTLRICTYSFDSVSLLR